MDIIIDAKNLIVGRFATVAAKKALLGAKVDIVNCESAVISGEKYRIFADYKQMRDMGTYKGPLFPRMPDRIVKRIIRGMLPYKQTRGRDALKRVKCYIGVPDELKDKKAIEIAQADVNKLPNIKYVTIKDVSKFLGAKV